MFHAKPRLRLAEGMVQPVVIALAIPGAQCIGIDRCERDVAVRVARIAVHREEGLVTGPSRAIERVFGGANKLLVAHSLAFARVEGDDVMLHQLLDARLRAGDGLHIRGRRRKRRYAASVDRTRTIASAGGLPNRIRPEVGTLAGFVE